MSSDCNAVRLGSGLSPNRAVETSFNRLTPAVFGRILYYLEIDDVKSLTLCDKNLSKNTVESYKEGEIDLIRVFIQKYFDRESILQTLENSSSGLLSRIVVPEHSCEIKIRHSEGLFGVLKIISKAKAELIDVAKKEEIKRSCVAKSEHLPFPFGFNDFFKLVVFENKIDAAGTILPVTARNKSYARIVRSLISLGFFNKAIEVVNLISDEEYRDCISENVFVKFLYSQTANKNIKFFKTFPLDFFQDYILLNICGKLSSQGDIDKAVEAALLICDWYPKKIGMESKYSNDELLQSADVNSLIRAAQLTGDRIFLAIVLKDISFQFLEAGEFDRATEIAKLIHRNQEELFLTSPYREVFYRRFLQSIVFKKISQKLLELGGVGNINKALGVAGLMLDTALRSSVLKDVPGKYLEAGAVSFAIKAVEWISISQDKDFAYKHIYQYFLGAGNDRMAVAFAGKISSSSDRDSAFVEICRKCLDHRMVSEAKVVTSFIGDLGLRDSLLKEIELKEIEFSAGE